MVKQANDVSNKVHNSVGAGAKWGIRVSIASQIWSNYMVAMASQESDLVAP